MMVSLEFSELMLAEGEAGARRTSKCSVGAYSISGSVSTGFLIAARQFRIHKDRPSPKHPPNGPRG